MSAPRRAGALAILLALLVKVLPTIYLIGRDHKLVGRVTGTRSWAEGPTRELLEYLLKAPAR